MSLDFLLTVALGAIVGIIAAICVTIKDEKEEKDDES